MARRVAFIYADQLSSHVLRADHPMRPVRLRYTYELLRAYHAFDVPNSLLTEPRPASEGEVQTYHTPEYVDIVRSLSSGLAAPLPAQYGFSPMGDNPVYPGMYNAALLSTGASLAAAELLLESQADIAFNISGGLHHAMPSRASGFCVFNDPAIAIKALVAKGMRVAYVDIDAHHGDGVQHAFYDTDAVLTISLHESGQFLFPGTGAIEEIGAGSGEGFSVNAPLSPYTGDETYLLVFNEVVPPLLSAFKPDALVTQLGIDTYYRDPLTHLAITSRGYTQAVQFFYGFAHNIPWLALGGGGYDLSAVARCWTLAYGIMSGQEWPEMAPPHMQQTLGKGALRDLDSPTIPGEMQEVARNFAETTVQGIKKRIFPHHGL